MHQSTPAEHARHDLELIAGHAAGDLSEPERIRADDLLHSCTSCADLRRDLVALASVTRTLPALAAPRDFRLTDTQAASLRRGSWRTSLLRPFAAPRSAVRPMAMAFTSLGLAGLLVVNILPALFGGLGSAGAAAPQAGPAGAQPGASEAAAATEAPAPVTVQGSSGGPQATNGRNGYIFGPASQPTAALDQLGGSKGTAATAAPGDAAGELAAQTEQAYLERLASAERVRLAEDSSNPMFVGSIVLLAVGLALFGLRFAARRVR